MSSTSHRPADGKAQAPTEYALLATWRWTRTLHLHRPGTRQTTRCGRPAAAYVTAATARAVLGERLDGAVCGACRKGER